MVIFQQICGNSKLIGTPYQTIISKLKTRCKITTRYKLFFLSQFENCNNLKKYNRKSIFYESNIDVNIREWHIIYSQVPVFRDYNE